MIIAATYILVGEDIQELQKGGVCLVSRQLLVERGDMQGREKTNSAFKVNKKECIDKVGI
jgi:hypothetical protein